MARSLSKGAARGPGSALGMRHMLLLLAIFLVGALLVQMANGQIAKEGFSLHAFLMLLPLFILAQLFIALGYSQGTERFDFIAAHIIWTGVLIAGTLIANFALFQSVPNIYSLSALLLAGAAGVLAVMGSG